MLGPGKAESPLSRSKEELFHKTATNLSTCVSDNRDQRNIATVVFRVL